MTSAPVDLAVEADAGRRSAARPISSPSGIAAETSTAIGLALAAGAAGGGEPRRRRADRASARSLSAASKPMSVCVLEIWPSEAKASCGLASRRFSVRMPASSRTARPESVVSPASSASRRGVAEREVGGAAVEGEVEAAAERADAAVGAQVDRAAERAVGEAGEDREVGDAHGVAPGEGAVLERPALKIDEAVAADLQLVDVDRAAGVQRGVGEEVDAGAERAGDLGLRRPRRRWRGPRG